MIAELFTALSAMLQGSWALALAASFFWGVLSVLLSPCHIAGIPLIVGFIDRQGIAKPSRSALVATVYAAGILLSLIIIGGIAAVLGRIAGDVGVLPNLIVAVLLVGIGLYLAGIINLPFLDNACKAPGITKKGLIPAFMLGLIFGIAVGPCTFAYLAPVLGISFAVASSTPVFAVMLVTVYALGHCLVIILGGTFVPAVQKYLHWSAESRAVGIIKKICGAIVIGAGIYLVYGIIRQW
jgi:cytochrome c-type biogenesis protein